ncbi:hypothetical protein ES703_47313 [subsurface metagenome]
MGMNFVNALLNQRKMGTLYDLMIAAILAIAWILYTCPYIK